MHSDLNVKLQFLFDFFAGGLAGAFSKACVSDIDLSKSSSNINKMNITDNFSERIKSSIFSQKDVSRILLHASSSAITFSVKDALNKFSGVNPKTDPGKFYSRCFLNGGLAGIIGILIVYPFENSTRLNTVKSANENLRMFNCVAQIIKTQGFQQLYQDFTFSLIGATIFRASYFGGYDAGKVYFWGEDAAEKDPYYFRRAVLGQCVVTVSEALQFPILNLRKMMIEEIWIPLQQFQGTLGRSIIILIKYGPQTLFEGFRPKFISDKNIYTLLVYDQLQNIFNRQKKKWNKH